MNQSRIIDGDQIQILQMQINALQEENTEMQNRILVLTRENLTTIEGIKKNCEITNITFAAGRTEIDEGTFYIEMVMLPKKMLLRTKDVRSFTNFQKKILAVTGHLLPNVDKSAWEIYLADQLNDD